MFKKESRYITRGANEKLDLRLQLIIWSMIDKLNEEGIKIYTDMGFSKKEIANTLNISVSTVARCRRHNKYEDEQSSMFDDILKLVEFDDIEESLEVFRTKIYFKSKVEPVERIPVTGRMMNFKDSSDETNS